METTAKISQKDLETWADILLNHSLSGIVPEDVVMLKGEIVAWPLISLLQDKIHAAGAVADVCILPPDNEPLGKFSGASIARHGTVEQIERIPKWYKERYETMTKYIYITGSEHPELFSNLPEKTAAAYHRSDGPITEIWLQKRWVVTLYPTQALADSENIPLDEFTDFVVKSSTVDPSFLEKAEEELRPILSNSKVLRIQTEHPKTGRLLELQMNIANRFFEAAAGVHNIPDGEIFTSPDANSVEGEIYVDLPISQQGDIIRGIYLKFVKGIVKDYSAEVGLNTLRGILDSDPGAKRLGEIALGMNNAMTKAVTHPLYLEKIGGTVHFALGEGFPFCLVDNLGSEAGQKQLEELTKAGVFNKSDLHIDLVCDFRPGGVGRAVYLDNTKLVIADNVWKAAK